jgi:hypothetical protein
MNSTHKAFLAGLFVGCVLLLVVAWIATSWGKFPSHREEPDVAAPKPPSDVEDQPGTTVGAWSESVDNLSARFAVSLAEHQAGQLPAYFQYQVFLEVRNDHGADLAFMNQPSFQDIEICDANGASVDELTPGGNHLRGRPRFIVIPPYTYVGIRVDTAIPVEYGICIGNPTPEKHSLSATLVSTRQTGEEAHWFGGMETPPARAWIGEIQVPPVMLPVAAPHATHE